MDFVQDMIWLRTDGNLAVEMEVRGWITLQVQEMDLATVPKRDRKTIANFVEPLVIDISFSS
jgi:hypothetical protein